MIKKTLENSNKLNSYDLKKLNPRINKINIHNYYCIENIDIEDIKDYCEIYFLGENGVGKTLLLQKIIKNIEEQNKLEIVYDTDLDEIKYQNIFAYGTGRLYASDEKDETGHSSLFKHNSRFVKPELFLKDIQRKEFLKVSPISLNKVIDLLTNIVNFENDKDLRIEHDLKTDSFIFIEKGSSTKFEHLADGYRSVLIWLCDLVSRLIENQPYITDLKDFYGIVLVDEIDMLLHPKWEQKIVGKLREKLPNIQWFFTTHSPMLILGASEDAVFYKLYKENSKTKISEPWQGKDILHLMANSIITSPLFDLPSAHMYNFNNSNELDTNPNYWYSRIEFKITEKLSLRKADGKAYFSKSEVDELVEWAINEIDREVKNDKSE